jgi:hypothetical protein
MKNQQIHRSGAKNMAEHMNVAGAITIIAIEPVLGCIVPLLMLLLNDANQHKFTSIRHK